MYRLDQLAALLGVTLDAVVSQSVTSAVPYVGGGDRAHRLVSHTSAATIATALSKTL